MSLFNDDFESYAINAPIPAFPETLGAWYDFGGGGHVLADPPPGNLVDPSLPTSSKCLFIGAAATTGSGPFFSVLITFSLLIGKGGSFGVTPLCSIINSFFPMAHVPGGWIGPYSANLLTLLIHPDLSLSLATNNGYLPDFATTLPSNSGITAGGVEGRSVTLRRGIWHMLQLSASFEVDSSFRIMAGGSLSLEGLGLLNGSSILTGYTTLSGYGVPNGVPIVPPVGLANGVGFIGAGGFTVGCVIDNVTMDILGSGWPFPATPPGPNALISQLAIEYAKKEQPTGRVSQLSVEIASIPRISGNRPAANARDSQLVVEILGSGVIAPAGGWLVKES